ncbi:MAG: tRNA (adenosine(37)-N6)-threonylcarbamoyltransferase complex ATPase subunit type 1 TsaE [Holosporaceae bacterium]|jgi:tRNA threonylcarbamoyladenosine biosynthesis protein TsaE|nr:tRNA (adenosine(37)-N6)-threonylcarbamoyltransferase complex ATPase subunit type 1 TsaE [Holosporaceae bacterium]
MTTFICRSLKDTKAAAEYFSQFAKIGQCFALSGDLGCGKTTFSRYLIRSLNPSIRDIPSPTFSLVQTYEAEPAKILHADCYRLKSQEECYELDLLEAIETHITIIEWPQIIEELLPADAIRIAFSMEGKKRKICTMEQII